MIRFGVLNKREKEIWLPVLFDLFYENMHHIAPSVYAMSRKNSSGCRKFLRPWTKIPGRSFCALITMLWWDMCSITPIRIY